MIRPVLTALTALFVSVSSVRAQSPEDYLSPPKELAKLDFLLGNWSMAGTYSPPGGPDGVEAPWTSRSTVSKVLGGHYLRDDLIVEITGTEMRYVARTYYGYDRDRKRFFTIACDNSGMVGMEDVEVGDGTVVATVAAEAQGQRLAVRSWSKVVGDTIEFKNEVALGMLPVKVEVQGRGERKGDPVELGEKEKNSAMAAPSEAMAKLRGVPGQYAVKGWVVPFPEAPRMDIAANETIESLFGGSVLSFHVLGEETPGFPRYEGIAFAGWDASRNAYREVMFDNMGAHGAREAHLIDGKLVSFGVARQYGTPTTSRGIVEFAGDGSVHKVTMDALGPTGSSATVFEGTYAKKAAK